MRWILLVLLLGFANAHEAPVATDRAVFAQGLATQMQIDRIKLGHPTPDLTVEAGGRGGVVLVIHDDDELAKLFYDTLHFDISIRRQLLELGFTVVVLVNRDHGTFVFTLEKDGETKSETGWI